MRYGVWIVLGIMFASCVRAQAFVAGENFSALNALVCSSETQGGALLEALRAEGANGLEKKMAELQIESIKLGTAPSCLLLDNAIISFVVIRTVREIVAQDQSVPSRSVPYYLIEIMLPSERRLLYLLTHVPVISVPRDIPRNQKMPGVLI